MRAEFKCILDVGMNGGRTKKKSREGRKPFQLPRCSFVSWFMFLFFLCYCGYFGSLILKSSLGFLHSTPEYILQEHFCRHEVESSFIYILILSTHCKSMYLIRQIPGWISESVSLRMNIRWLNQRVNNIH